jgi:hypothetical protein
MSDKSVPEGTSAASDSERKPGTLERALDELDRQAVDLTKHEAHCEVVDAICEKFHHLNIRGSITLNPLSVQGACILLDDLEDFRQAVPVCAEVIRAGYHPEGFEDYPELRRRAYNYGGIKVLAFLKYEGSKCEFKQVGVEEKPVYELVCN